MFLLQNSHDLLNLALTLAVLVLASLLAWLLVYFILTAKELYHATKEAHEGVKSMGEVIGAFREKMEHGFLLITLATQALKKVVGIVREKKEKNSK
ncbi:MAG: hypothetical protein WCK11_00770 [Candidatus Falkowbacteria bacterium]